MMRIIFCLTLWASCLTAAICELPHFHGVHEHLTPETLLVLDIDDTLLVPEQMLGCDEWFQHRVRAHKGQGLAVEQALQKALVEWEAIRHVTKMELVEPETACHVQDCQERGLTVIGLTTQRMALGFCTFQHLKLHGIDLTHTAPSPDDHYFSLRGHGVLYRGGILFTAGTPKGEALFALCDKLGYAPKRIVFVNDKASHLADLETTALARGVEFVGLRYAFSDARKAAFRPEIAEIQFLHSSFGRLLSDAEALSRLGSQ